MVFDGVIDDSIKDKAKSMLQTGNGVFYSNQDYIEMIKEIHDALDLKRKPFFNQVDSVVAKYDIQNDEYQLMLAKKELSDISVSIDLDAEKLVHDLFAKIHW